MPLCHPSKALKRKCTVKYISVVLLHLFTVILKITSLALNACCWTVLLGYCNVHSGYVAACSDTESDWSVWRRPLRGSRGTSACCWCSCQLRTSAGITVSFTQPCWHTFFGALMVEWQEWHLACEKPPPVVYKVVFWSKYGKIIKAKLAPCVSRGCK